MGRDWQRQAGGGGPRSGVVGSGTEAVESGKCLVAAEGAEQATPRTKAKIWARLGISSDFVLYCKSEIIIVWWWFWYSKCWSW